MEDTIQSAEGGRQGTEKQSIVFCNRKNDSRMFGVGSEPLSRHFLCRLSKNRQQKLSSRESCLTMSRRLDDPEDHSNRDSIFTKVDELISQLATT
jgi:hypothetical protein